MKQVIKKFAMDIITCPDNKTISGLKVFFYILVLVFLGASFYFMYADKYTLSQMVDDAIKLLGFGAVPVIAEEASDRHGGMKPREDDDV